MVFSLTSAYGSRMYVFSPPLLIVEICPVNQSYLIDQGFCFLYTVVQCVSMELVILTLDFEQAHQSEQPFSLY